MAVAQSPFSGDVAFPGVRHGWWGSLLAREWALAGYPCAMSRSTKSTLADADATPALPDEGPVDTKRANLGYLLATALLVGSMLLVALFWQHTRERELMAAQAEFVANVRESVELLHQRLIQYELTLRGGVALFGTVARPTPQQWQAYVNGINIDERFSGMEGLGFAAHVDRHGLGQLQQTHRESGYGLLEVRPRGVREDYAPLLYLQPDTQENKAAIGFDLFSQPVAKAAMEAARDSGQAQLSGVVPPVRVDAGTDASTSLSLLLIAPVYRAGDLPQSPQARMMSLQGWVFAPFRLQTLVEAVQVNKDRPYRFSIHDVTTSDDVLLYADPASNDTKPPAFSQSMFVDLYGRKWRLDFESAPLAIAAPRLSAIRTAVLIGVLAALLLFGLAVLLARTEARAVRIAGRMTENYRRSELRFRNAMRYSAIGAALLDHKGRVVEANVALERVVGRAPDNLVGMPFNDLFEDMHPGQEQDMEAIAEGVFRMTRQVRRGNGDLRQLQLTFAPIPGKIGQKVDRLVQVEDVSERLRAEARAKMLNRTLEARVAARTRALTVANKEMESFAYSVSHDLRAPLRAIEGFSKLLADDQDKQLDQAGRDYLERIRKATARMGELIESILKMSRISRGNLKMGSVDLSAIARETIAQLRRETPEREVETVITNGLHARGDAALLRNLLQNLLGNAWKFTQRKAHARIEFGAAPADDEDGQVEFFVRDNGAGFAPEYASKLFRPFQRLHSQDEFAGHGIGLASVQRIVERHGGQMRAEGQSGQGATFWFSLPVVGSELDEDDGVDV